MCRGPSLYACLVSFLAAVLTLCIASTTDTCTQPRAFRKKKDRYARRSIPVLVGSVPGGSSAPGCCRGFFSSSGIDRFGGRAPMWDFGCGGVPSLRLQ